uniref:N-acetylmuramoyl-L-alanine amidase family protein n=1 Tax=Acetatifactor sp. TaxID=1872090 RepID=UPI004056EC38
MDKVKERDFKKENMIITLVLWILLACGCMAVMLYVAARKTIVIADTICEDTGELEESVIAQISDKTELLIQAQEEGDGSIRIPLMKGTKAENVVMENRYMERELWIYLKGVEEAFYTENMLYGDLQTLVSGHCESSSDGVILKLNMSSVQEYRSTMESDMLVIACYKPEELYEQIVVVDPYGGGSETGNLVGSYKEKEIVLQVAKQLQKQVEQENIKIYFTRLEDEFVSYDERLDLVEEVNADLFIGISACADTERPEAYGIHGFYNENYFIPGFGNVQLADVLTRNVTVTASNRAIGITPAEEGSILQDVKIPAAEICVGYLSNEQEGALLSQQHYQEKLAEGLANAILEVYTNKDLYGEVEE